MAQPALSRTIKQLEETAGVSLFKRSQRSVELTPAGRSLLADARRLLQEAEAAVARARQCAHNVRATLSVGVSEYLEETKLLKKALPAFRREFPEVKLEVNELYSVLQIEALHEHKLDVGIMFQAPPDPALVIVPLEELEVRLVVPLTSPLAGRKSVHFKDLANERFLMFPRRWWPELYDRILDQCRKSGFEMKIAEENARMETNIRRVAAGVGVTIAMAHVAERRIPGVDCLKILDWPLKLQSHLVWRRDDDSPLVAAFVKSLLPK